MGVKGIHAEEVLEDLFEPLHDDANGAKASKIVQTGLVDLEMVEAPVPEKGPQTEGIQQEEVHVLNLSSEDEADTEAPEGGEESPGRRVEKRTQVEVTSTGRGGEG